MPANRPPNRASIGTWANPALAEGMRQLRRSNAAGVHADKRTRRARTKSAADKKAISDSSEQ
jgi:hypothetical protein